MPPSSHLRRWGPRKTKIKLDKREFLNNLSIYSGASETKGGSLRIFSSGINTLSGGVTMHINHYFFFFLS